VQNGKVPEEQLKIGRRLQRRDRMQEELEVPEARLKCRKVAGREWSRPPWTKKLLFRRFFRDEDLQMRSHVLVQFDGDRELADRLERFM
jgi:hypothetical protein